MYAFVTAKLSINNLFHKFVKHKFAKNAERRTCALFYVVAFLAYPVFICTFAVR
jgi:hypothetical protein